MKQFFYKITPLNDLSAVCKLLGEKYSIQLYQNENNLTEKRNQKLFYVAMEERYSFNNYSIKHGSMYFATHLKICINLFQHKLNY